MKKEFFHHDKKLLQMTIKEERCFLTHYGVVTSSTSRG